MYIKRHARERGEGRAKRALHKPKNSLLPSVPIAILWKNHSFHNP
jgi:hypothetical protein